MLLCTLSIPVLLNLVLASTQAVRPGPMNETPCWIFPNLRVLTAPGESECAIGIRDALRRTQIDGRMTSIVEAGALRDLVSRSNRDLVAQVERGSHTISVGIPIQTTTRATRILRLGSAVVAAVVLLVIPFSLLLRSSASAALPLALFYSLFSTAVVALISGRASTGASMVALGSLAVAPATLLHLAFCFPRETRISREAPSVLAIPYAATTFLLGLGSVAIWRTPALWPAFVHLLVAAAVGAWIVLTFACAFAMRESRSAIERARAKIVLLGSFLLPVVPTAAFGAATRVSSGEMLVLYLWSAAATMPLPIALAISRYSLFDLELDVRQAIARSLYLVVAACLLAGGVWIGSLAFGATDSLPDASSLLAICLVCVVLLEPLRTRAPHLLESLLLPRLEELRATHDHLERRLAGIDDEDEILGCVEAVVAEAIGARWGVVFLSGGGPARLTHAFGTEPPSHRRLADWAGDVLEAGRIVHLPTGREASSQAAALREAGVAVVASIESAGEGLGLLLLGPSNSRTFYTRFEIDFVRSIVGSIGAALFRARANTLREVRERGAAAGRIALALAHDTGKDIGWLRMLSKRLAECPDSSPRVRRDAAMITDLSEELAAAFQRVLSDASNAAAEDPELPRFDDVVEKAVRRLSNLHGPGRIIDFVDPSLREVRCPEYIGRVLGNLLDNAIHASPREAPVHLFGTRDGDWIRVVVEDRGCGIPVELGESVFEPGVSTRRSQGGSGIGLTVAREIAETLGGSIALEPREGGGTIATIRLPRDVAKHQGTRPNEPH